MENKIEKKSTMQYQVHTEIEIEASVSKVWTILMDNNELAKWSTSFQGMKGELKKNGNAIIFFLFGGKVREVKHNLIEFEENKIFAWSDPIIPGLRDHHQFIIKSISENKCKFIQSDQAKGFMALFIGKYMSKNMLNWYTDFNAKLRIAAEIK